MVLILAGGPEDPRAEALGDVGLEVSAGVALVANDQLAAVQPDLKEAQRDIAFLLVGGGEDRGAGCAVRRGEQVQAHAPEPAAVAAAVVVRAGRPKLRATGRFDGAPALDRRGVDKHDVVDVARAVLGEHRRQPVDRVGQPSAAFPVAGLLGQLGDQMPQPGDGDGEELAIGGDVHDRLGDGERDDLRVRHAAPGVSPPTGQEIVGRGEHRGEQQVEVGEHRGPFRVDGA